MRPNIIVLFFLFLPTTVLFAQDDNWQLFTNTDIGIQSSSITCIVEDKEHIIWIGTNGEGMFKYDWNNWIKFNTGNSPLPSNYITSLAVDSNNCLWIGTFGNSGGLTKHDGNNWKIYNIDSNTVYDIQIDNNGTFWMGSYWKGLIQFDGDTIFNYYNSVNTNLNPLREEIISVNVELDSIVLCGTELGGAAEFNKVTATWTEYFSPVVPIDLVINSIIVDAHKNKWFAGIQYISRLDSSGSWQVFDYDPANKYDFYHDVVLGDNNSLLFSSENGLLELNYSNEEVWENIKPPYADIDSIGCDGLTKDSSGNLWIGYNNGYVAVYNPDGIVGIKNNDDFNTIPFSLRLYQNYPNPFNPATTINYQLPEAAFVSLKVYDILGKEVTTLVNEHKNPGHYSVTFDATSATGGLPSGVYIYKLQAGEYSSVKKMLLTK